MTVLGDDSRVGPSAIRRRADYSHHSEDTTSAKVGHTGGLTLIIVMTGCVVDGQAELMMAEAKKRSGQRNVDRGTTS
jgi:hypothetical protein